MIEQTEEEKKAAAEKKEQEAAAAEDKKTQAKVDTTTEIIAKAEAAAERLEKANETLEKNMEKQARLRVEEMLGGTTEAGAGEKKEISDEEYAKKVMANDIEGKEPTP